MEAISSALRRRCSLLLFLIPARPRDAHFPPLSSSSSVRAVLGSREAGSGHFYGMEVADRRAGGRAIVGF